MGASTKEKVAALKALLQDDDLVAEVLGQTAIEQKSLDEEGVEYKEVDDGVDTDGDEALESWKDDDGSGAALLEFGLDADGDETLEDDQEADLLDESELKAKDDEEEPEEEAEEGEESEAVYLADLTVDEFAEMLAGSLDEVFGPYFDRLDEIAAAQRPAPAMSKKEAVNDGDLSTEVERLKEANKKLEEQLSALPKAMKRQVGYLASEDEETTVKEGDPILEMAPKPDEGVAQFINQFVLGQPQ